MSSWQELDDAPTPRQSACNWRLVLACHVAHLLTLGSLYSFSVLYKALLEDASLEGNRASAAAVGAAASCTMLACGLVTGALVTRYGHRRVGLAGALLLFLGLLLASLATTIPALLLTFGVLGGAGANLSFSPGIMLIPLHFKKNRALATGLGQIPGTYIDGV